MNEFVEIDDGDLFATEVEPAEDAAFFGGLEVGPGYDSFETEEFYAVVVFAEGEEEAAVFWGSWSGCWGGHWAPRVLWWKGAGVVPGLKELQVLRLRNSQSARVASLRMTEFGWD